MFYTASFLNDRVSELLLLRLTTVHLDPNNNRQRNLHLMSAYLTEHPSES